MDRSRNALSEDEATPSLVTALREHRLIGMAVGVLMERHSLTPEHAFDALRRQARSERVKVAQLAARIVDGTATLGGASLSAT